MIASAVSSKSMGKRSREQDNEKDSKISRPRKQPRPQHQEINAEPSSNTTTVFSSPDFEPSSSAVANPQPCLPGSRLDGVATSVTTPAGALVGPAPSVTVALGNSTTPPSQMAVDEDPAPVIMTTAHTPPSQPSTVESGPTPVITVNAPSSQPLSAEDTDGPAVVTTTTHTPPSQPLAVDDSLSFVVTVSHILSPSKLTDSLTIQTSALPTISSEAVTAGVSSEGLVARDVEKENVVCSRTCLV